MKPDANKNTLFDRYTRLMKQAAQLSVMLSEFGKDVLAAAAVEPAPLEPAPLEPAPAYAHKDILTTAEAAEFIGCSLAAFRKKVERKEITRHGAGRRLYFKKSGLTEWMLSNKKASSRELNEKADAILNGEA
jgi:excisionase family DNA binding protein